MSSKRNNPAPIKMSEIKENVIDMLKPIWYSDMAVRNSGMLM